MKHISVLIYFAAILVLSACTDDEVSKNSYSVEKKSMQDVIHA